MGQSWYVVFISRTHAELFSWSKCSYGISGKLSRNILHKPQINDYFLQDVQFTIDRPILNYMQQGWDSSRMYTAHLMTVSWGVCLLARGSTCPMALWEGRPPCGQTGACENIIFPQLCLRTLKSLKWKDRYIRFWIHTSFVPILIMCCSKLWNEFGMRYFPVRFRPFDGVQVAIVVTPGDPSSILSTPDMLNLTLPL